MLLNGYLDRRLKMKKKINKTKVTNGSKKTKSFSRKGKYYVTSTLALRRKMDYKKWIIICSKFFWRHKFRSSVWKYYPRRWEYY